MGERVSLCFSPPGRETQDGVTLLSPAADATFGGGEAGDLRSIERSILSAQGMWSNCDLYVQLPGAWFAANPILRIYARTGNLRAKVAEVAVGSLPQDPDAAVRTIALRVRGTPCEAFEVYGRTATTLTDGSFALQCWGTESTPERVGGLTIDGLDDAAAPARAAFMLGSSGGRWEPFTLSPSGEIYVVGTTTPSDAMANPTDAIGVAGYSLGWSQGNVRWERIQLSGNGEQYVAGREQPADGDANPTNAVPTQGYGMVWNGATWDRMASQVPGDSQANPTTGILSVLAKCQFWTGSDWRRLYGIGNTGIAAGATGAINVASYLFGWDGSSHRPATQKQQDATGLAVGSFGLQTASQLYALSSASVATPLRADDSQSLIVTASDPSLATAPTPAKLYSKGGTTVSASVKATAGRLFSVMARISHATAAGAWLMLFDKATAPAAADACIWQMWVPVNTSADLVAAAGRDHFGPQGYAFANGLAWGISTTADTYTAIGAVVAGSVAITYK